MNIAIIHDYLVSYGGAEKTFKVLSEIFPKAKLYTLFYNPEIKDKFFPEAEIRTSFLQKFPKFLRKKYQLLLPFLPIAAETLDFRDFDMVISSSHSFSKGIITRPTTTHICYCHTPTRYLWDSPRSRFLLHYFRIWDRQASERVDHFIACSKTVQKRIKKYYRRNSEVIYPPVEIQNSKFKIDSKFKIQDSKFFLIVSQLRKYKRIDLAVDAFNRLGVELVIIGQGPEKGKLQQIAANNIKFLGWQPDEIVNQYYKNCKAFIFPGEDDFGIAPVEAMSYGKPVLAFRKGGATETVIEGKTGEFFDKQDADSLMNGLKKLQSNLSRRQAGIKKYNPEFISEHAKKFSRQRFEKEIKNMVNLVYERFFKKSD